MNYKIALIRGDGIGPEIVGEAVNVLSALGKKFGDSYEYVDVDMNFIAAALTILGYSINATIVIFDRIRENSKGITDNKIFADITDRSIRQTMSRSINSSLTTVIPVILILVLGVPSIQNFAVALIVGIVSGTYSSVMLSGPIWVMLRKVGKKGAVQRAKKNA